MISSMAVPARMAEPAVGADFNADRLALAIENCGIICQVLQSQGLRPLHHSHVGGVFETEPEITQLLDTLGPDVIGFGPDTGHLRWAGIDPAALITRYADRIGGIHIKDVFPDYLTPAARQGLSYHQVGATKRLWAEPGHGVVDFNAIVAAIPARLRRRLHDRDRRTQRRIPLRLPQNVLRLGQPSPQLRLATAEPGRAVYAHNGPEQPTIRVEIEPYYAHNGRNGPRAGASRISGWEDRSKRG